MLERLGRAEALAVGTPVVLDIGAMRRANRERIRQIATAKRLSLQWHFVDAPQEVRRARVADRNTANGETFVPEVPPELFDLIEQLDEAPEPAQLEGAVLGVTD